VTRLRRRARNRLRRQRRKWRAHCESMLPFEPMFVDGGVCWTLPDRSVFMSDVAARMYLENAGLRDWPGGEAEDFE
jgi:hypothetical protein